MHRTLRLLATCAAGVAVTVGALVLLSSLPSPSAGEVTPQETWLLNPGFENTYVEQGTEQWVAPSWTLWYTTSYWSGEGDIAAPKAYTESNTVHGGAQAQLIQPHGSKNFDAAVYQQIGGITVGHYIRFSAWVRVETTLGWWDAQTRIGIDPGGGTDPLSINPDEPAYADYWDTLEQIGDWQRLSVVMIATSPTVTVYARAHPKYAQSFLVFWDDAEFSVVPEQLAYIPVVVRDHCYLPRGELCNPGLERVFCLEDDYYRVSDRTPYTDYTTAQIAPYWELFWNDDWDDQNPSVNRRPECGPIDVSVASYRVHSGQTAQQCGISGGGTFQGGIYQVITGTRVSDTLRFTIWGLGWTQDWTNEQHDPDYNEFVSDDQITGGLSFRVGIDPYGGRDYTSGDVIWSDFYDPYDAYHSFEVTATATYTRVSVWAYASPSHNAFKWNETFWDDASLTVIDSP